MEIMIVDDEPQVAEVLARSLSRQGHNTTVVHSGQEALELLKTVPPDAMFLDVSMPGMNGLDVMAEVKRRSRGWRWWSSRATRPPTRWSTSKELGAVDVIQKPSALTNYHRAIERLHTKNV